MAFVQVEQWETMRDRATPWRLFPVLNEPNGLTSLSSRGGRVLQSISLLGTIIVHILLLIFIVFHAFGGADVRPPVRSSDTLTIVDLSAPLPQPSPSPQPLDQAKAEANSMAPVAGPNDALAAEARVAEWSVSKIAVPLSVTPAPQAAARKGASPSNAPLSRPGFDPYAGAALYPNAGPMPNAIPTAVSSVDRHSFVAPAASLDMQPIKSAILALWPQARGRMSLNICVSPSGKILKASVRLAPSSRKPAEVTRSLNKWQLTNNNTGGASQDCLGRIAVISFAR